MNPELMVFTVLLTVISGGLFLILVKMILNFFREKRQGTGASLGTGELEAMIQRAVEAGNASLHDRLDDLEGRLDQVDDWLKDEQKALPAAQAPLLVDEVIEQGAASDERRSRSRVR